MENNNQTKNGNQQDKSNRVQELLDIGKSKGSLTFKEIYHRLVLPSPSWKVKAGGSTGTDDLPLSPPGDVPLRER